MCSPAVISYLIHCRGQKSWLEIWVNSSIWSSVKHAKLASVNCFQILCVRLEIILLYDVCLNKDKLLALYNVQRLLFRWNFNVIHATELCTFMCIARFLMWLFHSSYACEFSVGLQTWTYLPVTLNLCPPCCCFWLIHTYKISAVRWKMQCIMNASIMD